MRPTPIWAAQAFPDVEESKAQRRLARDLLEFCRLGPNDPAGHAGWVAHEATLRRRARKLTQLGLTRVCLEGPGTSLEIGLSPGAVWVGGGSRTSHGRDICPNIPTEEVFTSPTAGVAEGTFRCSMPLSFQGRVIEGIGGEFRSGRLVRLSCKREADRKLLAAFLDSEPNARRLGEVALVDATSRIGAKRRLYYNTLLDENAAVHIAFGAGFGVTPAERPRPGCEPGAIPPRPSSHFFVSPRLRKGRGSNSPRPPTAIYGGGGRVVVVLGRGGGGRPGGGGGGRHPSGVPPPSLPQLGPQDSRVAPPRASTPIFSRGYLTTNKVRRFGG